MKRKTITGTEMDVVSRWWRRHLCWCKRAGATSWVKRGIRRRERREGRAEARGYWE